MNTGENEQGLKKAADLARLISLSILLLHFYFECYGLFKAHSLTSDISDNLLRNIANTGVFKPFNKAKYLAQLFLLISLMGVKGRKSEQYSLKNACILTVSGVILYYISSLARSMHGNVIIMAYFYMGITTTGYILFLTGIGNLARIIRGSLSDDVFNKESATFPQEQRKLVSPHIYNIPTLYRYNEEVHHGWLNIQAYRSLIVLGNPGSGKSACFIEPIIEQQIAAGYSQFIFDFKYPELTTSAYNHYLKYRKNYRIPPKFCYIDFRSPDNTMRCNPIAPQFMTDIVDAIEAARTILLSISKSWAAKQGEFFVESPMNLLAAVIWFLRQYEGGKYCTLPHCIELIQQPYKKLFPVLQTCNEIRNLISAFIEFFRNGVFETLDSQVASAKIPLGRLTSPLLYWIMSGDDFTLDINNPEEPKIFCLGTAPKRAEALSPVLSLYLDRLVKIVNQPGKEPCAIDVDEAATLRADSLQVAISTGRSNEISVVLAFQDLNQLEKIYSKEEAKLLYNMVGNIAVGQCAGDTAKSIAERFHKTFQNRQSMSINSNDTSISKSKQLEAAITPSTISNLSASEFVAVVADEPDNPVELKAFHGKINVDFKQMKKRKKAFVPLPQHNKITYDIVEANFYQIQEDVTNLIESVFEMILNDPVLSQTILLK